MKITSGTWSINRPNRCSRCHTELADDKAMLCEKCRALQRDSENKNRKDKQADREIDAVAYAAALGVAVNQTSGITYYTTSGGSYQNISGAVFETGKSVREIHYTMEKRGLPKRHDPLKQHALVFTDEDIERIKQYPVRPGHAIINGEYYVSTSHLSIVINGSRQAVNKHARDGDWPTFLMGGERWNQVQGIEDYLTAKQRQKDVVELRRDTVRSYSDLNVPKVELPSPGQPHSRSTGSQSNGGGSEDANFPSRMP